MPSACEDVTAASAIPHGTMCSNMARSGSTLRAKPWIERPRETRTPTAAILRGRGPPAIHPYAGLAVKAAGPGRPRSPRASMTTCSTA